MPAPLLAPQVHPTQKAAIDVLDGMILSVGLRAPGAEVILWLEHQVLDLSARAPALFLQLILPSSGVNPAVSDPSRQAMVHFARACQPRLHGAAFVVRFDGFLGATVRSVLAAAIMVARPSIPVKLHGTIPDALLWLGRATPHRPPPAPLVLERAGRMASLLGSSLP